MKRPIILLLCLYISAIFVHEKILFNIGLLLVIGLFLTYKKTRKYAVVFLILLAYIFSIELNENGEGDICGRIVSAEGDQYILAVDRLGGKRKTFKAQFYSDRKFIPGQNIRARVSFHPVEAFKNHRAFNYRNYLKSKKIFTRIEILDLYHVDDQGNYLVKLREALKSSISRSIDEKFDQADFVKSVLLKIDDMDQGRVEEFRKLGLSHVLAISGLHINILIGILDFIGRYLGLKKKYYSILLLAFLVFYGFIVDFPISLTRALIMYFLSYLAIYTYNIKDDLNQIALAIFLVLLINPYYIYSPAFWLSFFAIISIKLIYPRLKLIFYTPSKFWDSILLISSIQVGLFPLQIYYFNQVNPVSILANLLIVPLLELAIMGSFLSLFNIPFLTLALASLVDQLLSFIYWIMGLLNTDLFLLFFSSFPLIFIISYYFILLGILSYRIIAKEEKHLYRLVGIFMAFCLTFYLLDSLRVKSRVNFIDIGQGDAILIRDEKRAMVDLGGSLRSSSYLSKNLYDYLVKNGVYNLDCVFLSHDDFDHMGNYFDLSKMLTIEKTYTGHNFEGEKIDKNVLEKGAQLDLGNSSIQVLEDGKYGKSSNDSSLILEFRSGDTSLLLTGDAEKTEDKIRGDFDIVKISHHGSGNSTSEYFLSNNNFSDAVISVGKNSYGHPDQAVLERLEDHNIRVYRTDLMGNIAIKFYKDHYRISYYEQRYDIFDLLSLLTDRG